MCYDGVSRLTKEYERLSSDLPTGVSLSLPVESDIYSWEVRLEGPESSLYKG